VAMTIAHKTKSKVPKVFKKYGSNLALISDKGRVVARYGSSNIKTFSKQRFDRLTVVNGKNVKQLLLANIK
jgi:hypothetical protein